MMSLDVKAYFDIVRFFLAGGLKIDCPAAPKGGPQGAMEHEQNQNEIVAIAPQPAAEKAAEAWECVICYENGKKTGQLTLACGHAMCLGCYTLEVRRVTALHQQVKCPYCRKAVRLTEEATQQEKDEVARIIRLVQADNQRVQARQEQIQDLKRQQELDMANLVRHHDQIKDVVRVRTQEALRLAEDYGLDVEATRAALALQEPVAQQPVRVNMAQARALEDAFIAQVAAPAPQPAAVIPQAQAEQPRTRCPGCHHMRAPEQVKYRHIPCHGLNIRCQPNCGTHRLMRCQQCFDAERAENLRLVQAQPAAGH